MANHFQKWSAIWPSTRQLLFLTLLVESVQHNWLNVTLGSSCIYHVKFKVVGVMMRSLWSLTCCDLNMPVIVLCSCFGQRDHGFEQWS